MPFNLLAQQVTVSKFSHSASDVAPVSTKWTTNASINKPQLVTLTMVIGAHPATYPATLEQISSHAELSQLHADQVHLRHRWARRGQGCGLGLVGHQVLVTGSLVRHTRPDLVGGYNPYEKYESTTITTSH